MTQDEKAATAALARIYADLVAGLDLLAAHDATRAQYVARWLAERIGSWSPPDDAPEDADESPHWRRLTRPPPGAVRAGAAQCRAALQGARKRH